MFLSADRFFFSEYKRAEVPECIFDCLFGLYHDSDAGADCQHDDSGLLISGCRFQKETAAFLLLRVFVRRRLDLPGGEIGGKGGTVEKGEDSLIAEKTGWLMRSAVSFFCGINWLKCVIFARFFERIFRGI